MMTYEYPAGPHPETHEHITVEHPGYLIKLCHCGRSYPVARGARDSGHCGCPACQERFDDKEAK